MHSIKNPKTLIVAALFTALTCVATMLISIPIPQLGYIHLGDGLVLLSGLLLGPVLGPLAAGIGSALADLFLGYTVYALPTLLIKGLTALTASLLFGLLQKITKKNTIISVTLSTLPAELVMMAGYFLHAILLYCMMKTSFTQETWNAGILYALPGILPNIGQALAGMTIAILLYPLLHKLYDRILQLS